MCSDDNTIYLSLVKLNCSDLFSVQTFLLTPFSPCSVSPTGGVVKEWRDYRPGGGQKLLHHHRPQPDHQAGASVRHGQLHVRGEEHRGQTAEHHSDRYRLRWVVGCFYSDRGRLCRLSLTRHLSWTPAAATQQSLWSAEPAPICHMKLALLPCQHSLCDWPDIPTVTLDLTQLKSTNPRLQF